MKQTLENLIRCNMECRGTGRPPEPEVLARVIMERIPPTRELQAIYFGEMGAFLAATLDGVMPDP